MHQRFLLAGALVAALVGVLVPAPVAHGHGGPPNTRRIAFHPLDADTLYAQATFGLMVSHDRGLSWSLVCEEAIGWQTTENPAITATRDDAVVLGLFKGLYRTATFCGADLVRPDLENVPIIDLAADPTDPSVIYAATSLGSFENGVFRSGDDGRTWTPTTGRFAVGELLEALRVAPSMPRRLYVSGVRLEPRAGFVGRSDDGGDRWEVFDIELLGAVTVILGAVDPLDPERLLAWRYYTDEPDQLMLSEDGGRSWDDVASVSGDLSGVAFSPDGSRVWYGGTDKGLHLSTDGGRTWEPLETDLAVRCLAAREGELWICADNFADHFAVGVSTDDGTSFEPRLVYRALSGQIECAEGTRSAEVCPVAWRAIQELFGIDAGPGPDGGTVGPDGGAGTDGGALGDDGGGADSGTGAGSDGGCGCEAAGRTSAGGARGLVLGAWLLALGWLGRRWRRPRGHEA